MLIPLLALAAATLAPDSTRWIVSNHGREAGDLVVITTVDSARARFVFTDRNRGTRVETRYRLGASGAWRSGETRAVLPDGSAGPATDAFTVTGDSIRFGVANGAAVALPKGTFATLRTVTPWEQAALARWLLAQPNRSGAVTRAGLARADVIVDTTLRAGATRQRARLVMIYRGASPSPNGVWLDEKGALLATEVAWFITVRPDLVAMLPAFRSIELAWRAVEGEALARKAITPVAGALAIRNGNVFDSERGVMVPRQTVVVRRDRIVAVGPAESTEIPAGATVIDATGKTVMPGLWEMHTHLQVNNQGALGLSQLAQGLTTARDLASDIDVAVSQRDRERAGKLAMPRIILAGFMEGPLAWAGPTATVVSTEAQARAWVARYDSLGYKQIKLYNVLHPDLVPVIAAEAHQRGMLLSGHIPRGMSMQAAVALGYDEVQHAAFFFSNSFPDSLYLPQMRAYSQVATAVAPTTDVNSPQMTSLIEFLRQRRTVIDGTFNLWIGGGGALVGAGGSPDQQKADSAYLNLIRRLYAAGVPMVAGTDNASGVTYRRELEMYALAGIPAPKILQMATIESARFMKDAKDYGSIATGKVADILVVDGVPAERIGDLQKLETVIRGGRLYKVSDLTRLGGGAASGATGWEGEDWFGAHESDHDRETYPLDNGLARTPPMGWNSWNKFGCNVSDKLIREVADAISANGMREAGYRYVTIDDCWQVARGANGVIVRRLGAVPVRDEGAGRLRARQGARLRPLHRRRAQDLRGTPGQLRLRGHRRQDVRVVGRGLREDRLVQRRRDSTRAPNTRSSATRWRRRVARSCSASASGAATSPGTGRRRPATCGAPRSTSPTGGAA